eukprot:Hpha_TRINITY_DN2136_c0_g1::TRINITY_DN2136_c0_g1_i1::g.42326::m.42326
MTTREPSRDGSRDDSPRNFGGWFQRKPAPMPMSKKVLNKVDYFQKVDVLATVRAGQNVTTSNWVGAFFSIIVLIGIVINGVYLHRQFERTPPMSRSEQQWSAGMQSATLMPVTCVSASGCLVGLLSDASRSGGQKCQQGLLRDSPWIVGGCRSVADGETVYVPLCYSGTNTDGVGMVWPSGEGGVGIVSEAVYHNGSAHPMLNTVSAGYLHIHYVLTDNMSQPEVPEEGEIWPSGRMREEYFTQHISPDFNATALCPSGALASAAPALGALLALAPAYTRTVVEDKGDFILHFIAEIGGMFNILTSIAAGIVALYLALAASVAAFQMCIPQVPDGNDDEEELPAAQSPSPNAKVVPLTRPG